ncbi:MAG: hypothetical protein V1806_04975 [Pseudomonadota bacterium]
MDLDDYAARGYPDLRRAMIITVHRPWSWTHPLDSALARQIRRYQTDIIRRQIPGAPEATEHHAMIYAGGGWCWSQDNEFELVHLRAYRGCVLTFWDADWSQEVRNSLVAECAPHNGASYGYRDLGAIYAWAATGRESWLEALEDRQRWICSESVCTLVSVFADPRISAGQDCVKRVPQVLANWMLGIGYLPLALKIA